MYRITFFIMLCLACSKPPVQQVASAPVPTDDCLRPIPPEPSGDPYELRSIRDIVEDVDSAARQLNADYVEALKDTTFIREKFKDNELPKRAASLRKRAARLVHADNVIFRTVRIPKPRIFDVFENGTAVIETTDPVGVRQEEPVFFVVTQSPENVSRADPKDETFVFVTAIGFSLPFEPDEYNAHRVNLLGRTRYYGVLLDNVDDVPLVDNLCFSERLMERVENHADMATMNRLVCGNDQWPCPCR